jgi:hypothetical protein
MTETNPQGEVGGGQVATPAEPRALNSEADAAEAIVNAGILSSKSEDYIPRDDREPIQQLDAEDRGDAPEQEQPEGEEAEPEGEADESKYEDVEVPTYTVQVGGKQEGVTLEELKSGYQKGADYTQKTQDLSAQRRAFEQEQSAVAQERQQYQEALSQFQQMQNEKYDQYRNVDWEALKNDDPMRFMTMREEMRDIEHKAQTVQNEQNRIQYQGQQQAQQQHQVMLKHEQELLAQKMPEWGNSDKREKLSAELKTFAAEMGYSKEELDAVTDHRSLLILNKARMYDKIQSTQVRKTAKVPKVAKPGSKAQPRDAQTGRYKQKMEKLKSSGRLEDAASVIFDRL